MRHLRSILIGTLAAFGIATAQDAAPATVQAATWQLGATLAAGIDQVPTPDVIAAFEGLRVSTQSADGPSLLALDAPIASVEEALAADPFDTPALVSALQDLALELRRAAEDGGPLLLTELASLVDQTSQWVEGGDFVPRMDVEME